MPAFLPHKDVRKKKRRRILNERREQYQYEYEYISPLAMLKDVPFSDKFALKWMWDTGKRMLTIMENLGDVEDMPELRDFHSISLKMLRGAFEAATFDLDGVIEVIRDAIEMRGKFTRPDSLDDYSTLFSQIGLPPVHREYHKDEVFVHTRLAGPNPVMMTRVDKLDDRFPVTDDHFQVALPGDSVEAAGKEGRLFLCDYQALEGLEPSNVPIEKHLYAPLALFAVDKKSKTLVAVAIQCCQTPGPDAPIFTPDDGYNWLIAKTIVGVADGNVHEPVTHLAKTHLFMEPFAVSTIRQLSYRHPLYRLLMPHFEGTLHINDLAQKYLIAPGGSVERLCPATIDSIRKVVVSGVKDIRFNDAMLPKTFEDRGVDDTDVLTNYPYRDDSRLYWDAIRDWVREYLAIYYKSNEQLHHDSELHYWVEELTSDRGGRLADFGQNGQILTIEQLVDAVTLIIYTSSVQHAAVNFPQYDLMSYVANMPLAGYAPAPISKNGATEEDFLSMLPPLEQANLQMCLGYALGTVHYTQLGRYDKCQFQDPRVLPPLIRFRKRLHKIGKTIESRNEHRRPYEFLMPKGIPQSINI